MFAGQVGFQNFLDVLADLERRHGLQVGMALEENDALDQLVGVVHFLDRFLALLPRELGVTPILKKPVVQPVLVDRAEFQKQRLVKPLDDLFFALHGACSQTDHVVRGRGRDVKGYPARPRPNGRDTPR